MNRHSIGSACVYMVTLSLAAGMGCAEIVASESSHDTLESSRNGLGDLRIQLHDAPTDDVDEVWIAFDAVSAHHVDLGWIEVSTEPQALDLLAFQATNAATIAEGGLSVGAYDEFRLSLTDAWVISDGVTLPLDVPSGVQSGVKVKVDFVVADCGEVLLDLDWDVGAHLSINPQGYKLRPTLLATSEFDDSTCTPSDCGVPGNLVPNCGLDVDVAGWQLEDGVSVSYDATEGNSNLGAASVISTNDPSYPRAMYLTPCMTLSAATTHTVGAHFKLSAGVTGPKCNTELIQFADAACTSFAGTYGTGAGVPTSGNWTQFDFDGLTTGAAVNSARLRMNCVENSGGANPFTILVDDAYVFPQ